MKYYSSYVVAHLPIEKKKDHHWVHYLQENPNPFRLVADYLSCKVLFYDQSKIQKVWYKSELFSIHYYTDSRIDQFSLLLHRIA